MRVRSTTTMTAASRGLVPFDQPVYLHTGRDDRADPVSDLDRRPHLLVIAFVCRATVVLGVASVVPFLAPGDVRLPATMALAVYFPTATLLDAFAARAQRAGRVPQSALVVADVAMLATLALLAERREIITFVGLLLVAFHRWINGRFASGLCVVLVVVAAAVSTTVGPLPGDWFTLATLAAAGTMLVCLVDDQVEHRSRAADGYRLVSGRAEAIVSGIAESIVTTDAVGNVHDLNPAASELTGWDAGAARGRRCEQLVGLRSDSMELSCAGGCVLLDPDLDPLTLWRVGRRGERQPLLAEAVPLHDDDGEIVEIVHSFRDITSLRQADEAKSVFLATASHELKTPLAVIHGFARLLRRDDIDDAVRTRAIDSIEARSIQLAAIVDRLLMSSRIEAGRIELHPTSTDIRTILGDRVNEFSTSTGREVHAAIDTDLPAAWSDAAAFTTVVDHLLDNAVKYSPGGGPVWVRAAASGAEVVVEIADEGIGMTDEQVAHCFERFWQAEGTDVRRFGGTGIGLYIVRSLVEAMSGTVEVASAPGRGSTFRIALQRRAPVPDAAPSLDRTRQADGEPSMIREFMRQVGVLEAGERRS